MRTSRDELRHLVADEAARLIYDDGMRDYRLAKLRAAENLGVRMQGSAQPTNEEVEEAIHQRIQLFDADPTLVCYVIIVKWHLRRWIFCKPIAPT